VDVRAMFRLAVTYRILCRHFINRINAALVPHFLKPTMSESNIIS
jgi:hypothetical protein